MSQERVIKTLVSLGLTQLDAKVYILLAKRGPIKAREAAKALKISKQRLYPILKNLRSKGIVNSSFEYPARFSAVQFEKVLDSFLKAKMEQVRSIQQNRDEILSDWQSIAINEEDSSPAKFTVIEGRLHLYSKIQQMIQDTREKLSFVATVPSLARADQFGLFDAAFNHPSRSKIKFRFLTELSGKNANAMKALLERISKADFNIEGKTPELGLKLCPRMVIKDEAEAVFFIDPNKGELANEQDEVCLWTNCKSLVHGFLAMFEDLWRNATDIEKKIAEIETGKLTPKTYVMPETVAIGKYYKTLQSAEEEIMLMTSSEGLIEYSKQGSLIEKWKKSGVQVKLMAPIVRENSKEAQQLQKIFAVRHVPENYILITIVDGKHLFQFKALPTEQETLGSIPNFGKTFYTNEFEYIEKMKTTLNDIWKNARTPSAVSLEEITGSHVPSLSPFLENILSKTNGAKITDVKPPGTISEKEVIDKIVGAEKIIAKDHAKDISRMYASIAHVAIHPPDNFNLPRMLILVYKVEKQSTFGAEDGLTVSLWLETPTGHAYVPVANVGDNPKSQQRKKAIYAGRPAGQNVQLVREDELQIRVHGNTMFVGWTVPIPLYPLYVLPPACLLIEGYGNVKTSGFTVLHPSGFKSKIEENYFDAFVTFIHPSSKYSGPGTDGVFARDYIMTTFPLINE